MRMNIKLIALFSLGILTVPTQNTFAGEQRIVGYANGKPLYVSGGPIVRPARPAVQPVVVREPIRARVNVGSSGCYHGPAAAPSGYSYGAGMGYGWNGGGYYDPSIAYGNYGNGYGSNHGQRHCPPLRANCQPYVTPYPAAASRGYSWIPRYGASNHIPKYK
jgi:hypothetical protein